MYVSRLVEMQDWTLMDDIAVVDIAGLDNDGLDIDRRVSRTYSEGGSRSVLF